MQDILTVTAVSKSYGALTVTDDLSFTLKSGEALGVIGPNGAGKSTLFNLIAGGARPDKGSVHYKGVDITGLGAAKRCRLGIGRSHQIPHPFVGMTVFENLAVGAAFGNTETERLSNDRSIEVLDKTGLLKKAKGLS